MKAIQFIGDGMESDDSSVIHLDGARGIDYTLCGLTLDGDTATAGNYKTVTASKITCPTCAAIIQHCRKAQI